MEIELVLVQSFVAVADELNFGRAADNLYVAQPALSQRIARLEKIVSVKLFNRTTRHVELTPEGAALYPQAAELLRANEQFVSQVRTISRGKMVSLRIGYTASTAFDATPRLVNSFLNKHPDVDAVAEEMRLDEVVRNLESGALDVGIGRAVKPEGNLEVEVIRHERLVAVMALGHRFAKRKSIRLAECAAEPLMLFPASLAPNYHEMLVELCRTAGFEPKLIQNPLPGMRTYSSLQRTKAIAIRPESARTLNPGNMAFVNIEDANATVPVVLMWRKDASPSEVMRKWIQSARDLAGKEGWLSA